MVSLSWIDIHYISSEINSLLQHSKIENIYGNHEELHIKLYKSGLKNTFISSFLSKGVILINSEKYQHNSKNIFIQYLRKRLKNATFVQSISYEKERILTLEFQVRVFEEDINKIKGKEENNNFEKKYEILYLHIELFMGGQIILTDSSNTIFRKLKQISTDIVENTLQYNLPIISSNASNNTLCITPKKLNLSENLQNALKHLGIGKSYIKYLEIFFNIESSQKLQTLDNTLIESLCLEVSSLVNYKNQTTMVYSSKDVEKDNGLFLPFNPLNSKIFEENTSDIKDNFEVEVCENELYSSKIVELYGEDFLPKIDNQEKEPIKLKKLKKRLEEQEKNLKKIQKESDKYELQASNFYEHYQDLQELQIKVNEIIIKEGFSGLKQKIKTNSILKKLITNINEKDKSLTINTSVFEEIKSNKK
ncbi:MAG: hypothetical protein ACMXYB_02525 [Candidatus Woesearchaeota archaeon]